MFTESTAGDLIIQVARIFIDLKFSAAQYCVFYETYMRN